MDLPINVALIGCGIYARETYAHAIEADPSLQLVACYSRSWRTASELVASLSSRTQVNVKLYGDDAARGSLSGNLDNLLARSDVHAVIIALPIPNLYDVVRMALKSGKHVLSEKPLAANLDQAATLLQEYRQIQASAGCDPRRSPVWYVAENWRMLRAPNEALDHVRRRGKKRMLGFRMRQSLLMGPDSPFLTQSNWRADTGLLLDGAIHGIAVLRQLLFFSSHSTSDDESSAYEKSYSGAPHGTITNVAAFANHLQPHLPAPDTLDCIARANMSDGATVTGTLQFSYGTTFSGPVWEIAYEDGVLCVDGFSHASFVPTAAKDDGGAGQFDFDAESGLEATVPAVLRAWVDGMVVGTPHTNSRLDPVEAGRDLQVLSGILQSSEQGGKPVAIESL